MTDEEMMAAEYEWGAKESAHEEEILGRLKKHPAFYEAARYGSDALEDLIRRCVREQIIEGEISVDELLESMGDTGWYGGCWEEFVDSWHERFRERDASL